MPLSFDLFPRLWFPFRLFLFWSWKYIFCRLWEIECAKYYNLYDSANKWLWGYIKWLLSKYLISSENFDFLWRHDRNTWKYHNRLFNIGWIPGNFKNFYFWAWIVIFRVNQNFRNNLRIHPSYYFNDFFIQSRSVK